MATFEETVLARSPLLFARCKELGTPSVIADYSGHGNDMDVIATVLLFGQESGVETDPEARSVYIPDGFAENIGQILSPASELLFDGNFTMAAFVKDDVVTGGQYIAARGGIANSGSEGIHFRSLGSSPSRTLNAIVVTTDGMTNTSHTVSATINHLDSVWNFHVLTRNGPVLRLWTNAVLTGENAAISSDLIAVGTGRIKFGAAGNNLAPLKGWAGEFIICDFAWTEDDVVEVYESAINSIFLKGRSSVVVSATLNSNFEPDPISFPWRHNWSEVLTERLSFRSAISSAKTKAEEANARRTKPRREVEFSQLLKSNEERRRLRAMLWANQTAKWFVPLRQYTERLVEPLPTSSTLIPITTAFKDYELDSWIGLRQLNDDGSIRHWEERLIVAVNENSIECEATENDYSIGAEVYPVKRGLLDSSVSVRAHTDSIEELTVTARLLPEDEPVIPTRITLWTPAIKYRDWELFNPFLWPNNWDDARDFDVEREVEEVDFDDGRISPESDALATESFTWRSLLVGYEQIAEFLGWYYERRGRWRYLWVPSMQEDFAPLGRSGNQLLVADTNYSDSYALGEPRRDLAFVYYDNTIILRRVVGFSGTGDETLELDQSVPTFSNLRCLSLLKFCRLDGDQIELGWETNDKVQVVWRFREMTHSPEGAGRTSQSPSASISPSPSASISVSLSPSSSVSPSASVSPSSSESPSLSPSASSSPSLSPSASQSPSSSDSPSPSFSSSVSPSSSASPST